MLNSFIGIKAVNVRDYKDNAQHRQAMGYFKHTAHKMKISQAELLKRMQTKSLEEINREWMGMQGYAIEFSVKKEK